MGDRITVTVRGIDELVAAFDESVTKLPEGARKVVSKGALNIKTETRRRWQGIAHAPRLPYSVTYDTWTRAGAVGAEIGPVDEPNNQGFLGRIIELGAEHNAPIPALLPALALEEPRFLAACENLLVDILPS